MIFGNGHVSSALKRLSGRTVIVVAAVAMMATACGSSSSKTESSGSSTGKDNSVPTELRSITANPGEYQLPDGKPGAGKPAVVIGTKDFPEQLVLGNLYAQALQAKGYNVNVKANIGGSEVIDKAFESNQIQMYPEYLGEIATTVAGNKTPPATAQATYDAAKQFEESQRQATIIKQTPFQNTDVLIAKKDFASKHNLKSVPDLSNVGPGGKGVTLAAQPSFKTRPNGLVGMADQYGLNAVDFRGVNVGSAAYQALDSGAANVSDAFSTDAQLISGDYVQLKDPKNIFGSQYVSPVIKKNVVDQQGAEFQQTLNWVSSLLTTDAIQALNKQVQSNGATPDSVAKQFLQANGLK